MHVKLAIGVMLAVLLVVFTAQNYEVVELRFLFWRVQMSRAVMLLGVLGVGFVLGWITRSFARRHPGETRR